MKITNNKEIYFNQRAPPIILIINDLWNFAKAKTCVSLRQSKTYNKSN